ncbi:hypothetical protein RI129_008697 [Pyrocoelia pectoralis]|uniref:Purine nucleoside phosphorylase n=1 Tax=Pyrocoelia pectoralis TaxID=417401 RepID=A0AAN7ZDX1_9COLE
MTSNSSINDVTERKIDGVGKRVSDGESSDDTSICTYELIAQTAQFLLDQIPLKPKIGIICGTGLGPIADALENPIKFPYENIPNFPLSTVTGHAGQLVFGYLSGVFVVCMQGRFHYFEGYPLWKCTMPVRVMKLLGVGHLILSNAAGGLNKTYKVGDIMIIKDHINMPGFAGNNPLRGPNEERFGPRFPSMHGAYNKQLIDAVKQISVDEGLGGIVHDGVYVCLGGPSFETVAELNMLFMMVITARHCNMDVFAFSLITNVCITSYHSSEDVNHEEVLNTANSREYDLKLFVSKVVAHINSFTQSK